MTPHVRLYSPGDLVYLHDPGRLRGKAYKLLSVWDGPFKILWKQGENDVYQIQHSHKGGDADGYTTTAYARAINSTTRRTTTHPARPRWTPYTTDKHSRPPRHLITLTTAARNRSERTNEQRNLTPYGLWRCRNGL